VAVAELAGEDLDGDVLAGVLSFVTPSKKPLHSSRGIS
jgi:hypothetical protein